MVEVDLSGNANHGTVTGAILSDHPPLGRYVPLRRFSFGRPPGPGTITDSFSFADTLASLASQQTISDAFALTETDLRSGPFVVDTIFLTDELIAKTFPVFDEIIFAEFAWRQKGSTLLNMFELPHVLSIRVTDEATISDKKIQNGEIPLRTLVGKPGRVVEIQGWSDSQSELDAMDALADGTRRTFIHPSGDSFAVLVATFDYDRTADQYTRRGYRLTLKETR